MNIKKLIIVTSLLFISVVAFCACTNRYDATLIYNKPSGEARTLQFSSTDTAKVLNWLKDQSAEDLTKISVLEHQE